MGSNMRSIMPRRGTIRILLILPLTDLGYLQERSKTMSAIRIASEIPQPP